MIIVILLVVSIIGGPIIINELYKFGNGYLTLWGASDVFCIMEQC